MTHPVSPFFWGTVVALALGTLGLTGLALRHDPAPVVQAPAPVEIPDSRLADMVVAAAARADAAVEAQVEDGIDRLFVPVYAAIPRYADFHYSVRGEYIELFAAARGQFTESVEAELFAGFETRLTGMSEEIDAAWHDAFETALSAEIDTELEDYDEGAILSQMTQAAISDTVERAGPAKGVQAAVLATSGAAAVKHGLAATVSATLSQKLALAASKLGLKSVGLGGGAMAGAGVGVVLGPVGAAAGGLLGGIVAWFTMDAVVVSIDELLNRETFEAELVAMVDESRADVETRIRTALENRPAEITGTLRERLQNTP